MDKKVKWIKRAIKDLEKQVPQKVKRYKGLNETACPNCGFVFGYYEYEEEEFYYCYNCGQKLNWLYSDLDELIDFEYGKSEVK